jgi:acetyl esterase/lipase
MPVHKIGRTPSYMGKLAHRTLLAMIISLMSVPPLLAAGSDIATSMRVLPPRLVWAGKPAGPIDWKGAIPAGSEEGRILNPLHGLQIYNVSTPTFQPYLPQGSKATGAAVIVAPGGGFRHLTIDSEGSLVARWLADRGIAAFVLKYRTVYQLPTETHEEMAKRMHATMSDGVAGEAGVVDGVEALRQIRAHASEFGIDPHRIGVVGFSAGAHVASMMTLNTKQAERPDFAGIIYGMPFVTPLPAIPAANLPFPPGTPKEPWLQPKPTPAPGGLPPMFLAVAQDDLIAGMGVRPFYEALFAAGYRPEYHLYQGGGHGFGMRQQGTTSDLWIEEFGAWLKAVGLVPTVALSPAA